ncbi:MAG: response regulator [Paracoccaceae bacterium]
MTGLHDLLPRLRPTPDRPLQGQTVLIVDDSRFAGEALRQMGLRSGARIRRADSLATAGRHLRTYGPSVVIVDMGLPDGSGAELITTLAQIRPAPPAILAVSGDPGARDAALAAGAGAFLEKPLGNLAAFQAAVLSQLPPEERPAGPRPLPCHPPVADAVALRDDLIFAERLLGVEASRPAPEPARMAYLARFLAGVGRASADEGLSAHARAIAEAGRHGPAALAELSGLVGARLVATQSM